MKFSDEKDRHREDIAASTPYMPQSGNRAGKHHLNDMPDQRVGSGEDTLRNEHVAGSGHFIPQSGRPAGKSSL